MSERAAVNTTDTTVFPQWEQAIRSICGSLQASPPRGVPFRGRVALQHAGALDIVEHNVNVNQVKWDRSDIAQAEAGYCFLIVQLDGVTTVRQGKQDVVLRPGDCTLLDSLRDLEMRTPSGLHQLSFHVPRGLVTTRLPTQDIPCGLHLPGDSGPGAVLGAYAKALYAQAAALSPGELRYRDSLLDLMLAALPSFSDMPDSGGNRILQRVLKYMEENLADPDLGARRIAFDTGVSTRHLHRLFMSTGQSVGEWILQRRLENARRDLGDLRNKSRSILDVAFDWGFNDASHFSRAFRSAYGLSPRDHRRQALRVSR